MANSKSRQKIILFKGAGSGSALDLGGMCTLFSCVQKTQSNPERPAKIERVVPKIQRPTRQQIADAIKSAKQLVTDYTEEKLAVAKGFKVHGEVGYTRLELVY